MSYSTSWKAVFWFHIHFLISITEISSHGPLVAILVGVARGLANNFRSIPNIHTRTGHKSIPFLGADPFDAPPSLSIISTSNSFRDQLTACSVLCCKVCKFPTLLNCSLPRAKTHLGHIEISACTADACMHCHVEPCKTNFRLQIPSK